jgi:hypothetical protein
MQNSNCFYFGCGNLVPFFRFLAGKQILNPLRELQALTVLTPAGTSEAEIFGAAIFQENFA